MRQHVFTEAKSEHSHAVRIMASRRTQGEVGTKWKRTRGCLSSQAFTLACLCVA